MHMQILCCLPLCDDSIKELVQRLFSLWNSPWNWIWLILERSFSIQGNLRCITPFLNSGQSPLNFLGQTHILFDADRPFSWALATEDFIDKAFTRSRRRNLNRDRIWYSLSFLYVCSCLLKCVEGTSHVVDCLFYFYIQAYVTLLGGKEAGLLFFQMIELPHHRSERLMGERFFLLLRGLGLVSFTALGLEFLCMTALSLLFLLFSGSLLHLHLAIYYKGQIRVEISGHLPQLKDYVVGVSLKHLSNKNPCYESFSLKMLLSNLTF